MKTIAKTILTIIFLFSAILMLGWHSLPAFLAALAVCGLSAKALHAMKVF